MKKLTIALLAIAAVAAPAQIKQTWTNTLDDPTISYRSEDTAVAPNGSVFTISMADNYTARLTCLDGLGNTAWTKNYDIMDTDGSATLLADSQGNLLVQYLAAGNEFHLMKVDGATGNTLWNSTFAADAFTEMEVDGQENIILLGGKISGQSGPVVYKFSPSGVLLNTRNVDAAANGYWPRGLAVSANGQIYTISTKYVNGVLMDRLEALTPNFTLRYATSWADSDSSATISVASDRNGRVCTADIKSGNNTSLQIRTFNAAGAFTVIDAPLSNLSIYELKAEFDANGRFVVGSSGYQSGLYFMDARWYAVTETTATAVQRAKVNYTDTIGSSVRKIMCDSFGQTYLFANVGESSTTKTSVVAFDENRTTPVWSYNDTYAPRTSPFSRAAVGRWGQVASTCTYGDPHSMIGVSYIKQLGLRNLLINGQSFTGGRTITGTVNFYGSHTAGRTVNLTSNSNYAVVNPSATIAVGASQAGMSIELKPTSVRRAVRIEGTFGVAKRSVVFYIEPPVASGLTVYPTSVKGGTNVNGSARINGAAPAGGMVVTLSSSDAAAVVPNSVTVAEGAITKAFLVNTNVVSQTKIATLTATTGSTSKTATLTITP